MAPAAPRPTQRCTGATAYDDFQPRPRSASIQHGVNSGARPSSISRLPRPAPAAQHTAGTDRTGPWKDACWPPQVLPSGVPAPHTPSGSQGHAAKHRCAQGARAAAPVWARGVPCHAAGEDGVQGSPDPKSPCILAAGRLPRGAPPSHARRGTCPPAAPLRGGTFTSLQHLSIASAHLHLRSTFTSLHPFPGQTARFYDA